MRRFLAFILMVVAANVLLVLLLFKGAEMNFLNPDFYLARFKKFNLYGAALKQGQSLLLAQIQPGAGFPLTKKQTNDLAAKVFSLEYLQKETEIFFRNFFFWFKSDDLASNLKLAVSLSEPKKNFIQETQKIFGRGQITNLIESQVPDNLDLSALDKKSAAEVEQTAWQARYYYNLLQRLEKLFWGGLALFLIFIVLLLIDSSRAIARYLGGVALMVGIELSFFIFVLPAALARFFLLTSAPEGISQEFYHLLTAMGLDMVRGAFEKLKIIGWIFLGIGAFLFIASYLLGYFKDRRKRLKENILRS